MEEAPKLGTIAESINLEYVISVLDAFAVIAWTWALNILHEHQLNHSARPQLSEK